MCRNIFEGPCSYKLEVNYEFGRAKLPQPLRIYAYVICGIIIFCVYVLHNSS